ncbi:thiopeptide-type bacteriocin biosynthesis protein [Kitasatospora sp. NPDC004669]|uniref:thiopeptide-type bacteriocin biosynthesis protein n=1 Tax=Kitasatospora sp. NPDC004669 TaxID=3154555 RepID=UPI0033A09ECF
MEESARWTAWHLHLPAADIGLQDRAVAEVVTPTVAELPGTGWFFVRYWQAGPHVRLRLRGLADDQEKTVERSLTERMDRLCADLRSPGLSTADYLAQARQLARAGENGSAIDVEELLPAGVHRSPYQPEFQRYGGRAEMAQAEESFQRSSEIVASLLAGAAHRGERHAGAVSLPPGVRFKAALQATAAALEAAEQDEKWVLGFCEHGVRTWGSWLTQAGTPQAHLDALSAEAARLGAQLTGIRALLPTAGNGTVRRWADGLGTTMRRWRTTPGIEAESVLFSHIHMLHNRLGTAARAELLCYAVLHDVLSSEIRKSNR